MSDLLPVLILLATPAAILGTVRFLIARQDRREINPVKDLIGAVKKPSGPGRCAKSAHSFGIVHSQSEARPRIHTTGPACRC